MSGIGKTSRIKSLWVTYYVTGCGGIELLPVITSRFDAERFGIITSATPRQSDVLVVSGFLTTKTLRRIIRTYEQMPDPKYVVALGACTINGGIYWDSYSTADKLELYIPVDVYIAGCMPRPESIFMGFAHLMAMIKGDKADGWKRYHENYKWYKKNQDKALGNSKKWRVRDV